jgi:hypothetical protein
MKKSNVFVALFLSLSLVLSSGFAASKSDTLAAPKKKVHGSAVEMASNIVKAIGDETKLNEWSAISEGTKKQKKRMAARTKQTISGGTIVKALAARTKQKKRSEA